MSAGTRIAALALGLSLVACDAARIPGNDYADVYDFHLPTDPPSVLRWPNGTTIRVYLVPSGNALRDSVLAGALGHGADVWNAVALFDEYRISATTTVADADVVLGWADVALPVETTDCPPAATVAVTTFCLADGGHALSTFPLTGGAGPGRVKMVVSLLPGTAVVPGEAQLLVAHELGHVLGIGQHSPNPGDLMFARDQVTDRPTRRDAATVLLLYHLAPDITP